MRISRLRRPAKRSGQEDTMKYWQSLLSKGYKDIESLQKLFSIPPEEIQSLKIIQEQYPVFVNPYYLYLIDRTDPNDPIQKMSIPSIEELNKTGSFDTSGEQSNTVLPGLQHKYNETVLLLSTNQCAMYCRHCFRKRLVGLTEDEICSKIGEITSYILKHPEVNNVLISGGDAFMNSNETISRYLSALCSIPHLDFIRFGTRTPVVLPQRITSDSELTDLLRIYSQKKKIYVVTQFNHPKEITYESTAAVEALLTNGIPVRNQTVLLKGVNDDSSVLGRLLRQLTSIGVLPYYVFQCRPVTGVMNHFQVPLRRGYRIVQDASQMQNGQGKSFRFMMSHVSGKIEILGPLDGDHENMLFKYHQAKDPADAGRLFVQEIAEDQCWL